MDPSALAQARIRELNDRFRAGGPGLGHWVTTPGIRERGPAFVIVVARAVQTFDDFTSDNDPYGEHDFGALTLWGSRIFWKIDYYDPSMQSGSDDPSNPLVTCRLLTIMLASEY